MYSDTKENVHCIERTFILLAPQLEMLEVNSDKEMDKPVKLRSRPFLPVEVQKHLAISTSHQGPHIFKRQYLQFHSVNRLKTIYMAHALNKQTTIKTLITTLDLSFKHQARPWRV
jgi:hypothetical protein